ncbi:hypothetical protein AB6A40_009862 [Gnathostoma spinigerum]|uniref:Carbonic anhydrase n=1 Tax=Gnathostoma spinigerum TaxID=75299 RepID=A0ABD6ET70_9BILA
MSFSGLKLSIESDRRRIQLPMFYAPPSFGRLSVTGGVCEKGWLSDTFLYSQTMNRISGQRIPLNVEIRKPYLSDVHLSLTLSLCQVGKIIVMGHCGCGFLQSAASVGKHGKPEKEDSRKPDNAG